MYSILKVNGLVCGLIKLRAGNLCFKLLTRENLVLVIITQLCNCCIVLGMEKKNVTVGDVGYSSLQRNL